ncbi:YidC/Oxa1 family insertase periplasmic-domain containing protein, partial [Rhizobium leguminosarum]|uniref:YidC/Oxa1 family insertase periplasmic-domain containing protein n=1 Tax=Rhizobium leguminosarum TaxID=384 RepID=UPI003F9469C2
TFLGRPSPERRCFGLFSYTNDKGLTFTRTISVDKRYMFTVADKIENTGQVTAALSSYGRVTRYNKPTTPSVYVLHEG